MEKPALTQRHVNLFALANGLNMMAQTIPLMYLTLFMTDYLHISPVAIGTGLLIAKTVDFLVGLVAGIIIEKSRLKHKYLSWIRLLTVTLFFGNIVQVLDTTAFISSPTVRLAIVCVFYAMFHCSMNFNATARATMIAKMAGADMEGRKMITARQAQVGAAASIVSSAVTLPAIHLVEKLTGSPSLGYFVVALIFSSCFAVTNLIFCKSAEGFDPPAAAGTVRKTATVAQMVQSVVTNKQMLVLFFGFTFFTIGTQIYSGVTAYFFRVTGNFSYMTIPLTARSICAFLASMIGPTLGRKLGKKKALLTAWFVYAAGALCLWKFALRPDGTANLPMVTVIMCLCQSAMYLYTLFLTTYYLDCGEYGYYTSGIDNRTMAVTVMNWPTKIGFALGGSLVGYTVGWAGYHAPVDGAAAYFESMDKFLMVWGLFPAVLMVIGAVIIMLGYKLTDEQAAMYARANAERELSV